MSPEARAIVCAMQSSVAREPAGTPFPIWGEVA
jgi:hypothetical protein